MSLVLIRYLNTFEKENNQCNSKSLTMQVSAHPDLATNLLQIFIPTNRLLCQKWQSSLQPCPRQCFVLKIFGYYPPKIRFEHSSLKYFSCPRIFFRYTDCPKDRLDGSCLRPGLKTHFPIINLMFIIFTHTTWE